MTGTGGEREPRSRESTLRTVAADRYPAAVSSSDDPAFDPVRSFGFEANRWAARATRAWLTGRGLGAEVRELQEASSAGRIAAPGLARALSRLGDACTESCNAASSSFLLLDQELDEETLDRLEAALSEAKVHATSAERWMRRLAELCGGVSAQLPGSDEVERADRAAVVALRMEDEPVPLVDDGPWQSSTSMDELRTELGGYLFRMIIDHRCRLEILPAAGSRDFSLCCEVDAVGNLEMTLESKTPLNAAALVLLGWSLEGSTFSARWDDPLPIREPVELVRTTLNDYVMVRSPTELSFDISSVEPDR